MRQNSTQHSSGNTWTQPSPWSTDTCKERSKSRYNQQKSHLAPQHPSSPHTFQQSCAELHLGAGKGWEEPSCAAGFAPCKPLRDLAPEVIELRV